MSLLFGVAEEFSWSLEAWAILDNHYHFVARSPENPATLKRLLGKLHMKSAKFVNEQDGTPGRRVWFQFWETRILHQASYLARLAYVHANPVHHKLVERPEDYPWCSASWFVENAPHAFVETVRRFRLDRVNVKDYW